MDKYKELEQLFNEGKYEDIVKLVKDSKEPFDLFFYISAEMGLLHIDEALHIVEENKKILEKDYLPFLIDVHTTLLSLKNDIVGLVMAKDYYKELPYHSQEVEEKIAHFDEVIEEVDKNIKNDMKDVDLETAKKYVLSDKMDEVYFGLKYFEDHPDEKGNEFLKEMLVKHPQSFARVASAIYLGERGYDEEVDFLDRNGNIIKINPKENMKYHTVERSNQMMDIINKYLDKNTSLIEISKNLLTLYELRIYPQVINLEDETFFEAMSLVAKQYLGQEVQTSIYMHELMDEINDIISTN